MPINSHYYHRTMRAHIVQFGNLFNEIVIQRYDDTNAEVGNPIKVPIGYAPKEKFLVRLNQDAAIDTDGTVTQMTLPRMGFQMVGMEYDAERKLNTLAKQIACDPDDPENSAIVQFQRVPWNFNFELYIMTKHYDDALQILEQIYPAFAPQFMLQIQENKDFPDEYTDVPLVYNSTSFEEEYEDAGTWETRRALIYTLSFTQKGYLYSPTENQGIIREVNNNINDATNCGPLEQITVTPDPPTAGPGDDFGFDIDIDTFDGTP